MRKHAMLFALTFIFLAGFGLFTAWAFLAAGRLGGGWRSLEPIWPYVAGGVVATGALAGVLMWLAFYSSRRGYDDRAGHEEP